MHHVYHFFKIIYSLWKTVLIQISWLLMCWSRSASFIRSQLVWIYSVFIQTMNPYQQWFCITVLRLWTGKLKIIQGTKIFQYCTCPAGRVTYNFHSSCKHNVMHLSFKSVCNKEHKGVKCNMTSSSYSSQSTHPTGRVLWEELLILSWFHS